MQIQPYLFFEGRAEEALEFYQKSLGAKVEAVIRYKENPDPKHNPPNSADKLANRWRAYPLLPRPQDSKNRLGRQGRCAFPFPSSL